MDHQPILATSLVRVDVDKFKRELTPIFATENGDTVGLRMPSGLVGPVALELRSKFGEIALTEAEQMASTQPIRLFSSRGFQTKDGRTGLTLEIEGFEVSILVTADMLADVRSALDEVEELAKKPFPKKEN